MRKLSIVLHNEYRDILENGQVIRYVNGSKPYTSSEQWRVTGAVILNNFSRVVERLTLTELMDRLSGPSKIDLFYKNGKPKFRITDIDHGTNRQWGEYASFPHRNVVLNT